MPPFDCCYFAPFSEKTEDRSGNSDAEVTEYLCRSLVGHTAGVLDFLRTARVRRQSGPRLCSFVAKVVGGEEVKGRKAAADRLPVGLWTDVTLDVHKRLMTTRGAARLLIATRGDAKERIAGITAQCGEIATLIPDEDRRTFICDELEEIPYGDVVSLLQSASPESAEIAPMLTTRIDIDWGL